MPGPQKIRSWLGPFAGTKRHQTCPEDRILMRSRLVNHWLSMTFTTISENSWVQPSPKVTLLPVVVVFTLSNHQFPRWSGYMFLVILDGSHCWKSLSSLGVCQTASYARGKRSPYSGHFDYVFTEYILHAYIYIYTYHIYNIDAVQTQTYSAHNHRRYSSVASLSSPRTIQNIQYTSVSARECRLCFSHSLGFMLATWPWH